MHIVCGVKHHAHPCGHRSKKSALRTEVRFLPPQLCSIALRQSLTNWSLQFGSVGVTGTCSHVVSWGFSTCRLLYPSHEPLRDHQESDFVCKSKEPLLQARAWTLCPFQSSGSISESQAELRQCSEEVKDGEWGVRESSDSDGGRTPIGQEWGNRSFVRQWLVLALLQGNRSPISKWRTLFLVLEHLVLVCLNSDWSPTGYSLCLFLVIVTVTRGPSIVSLHSHVYLLCWRWGF